MKNSDVVQIEIRILDRDVIVLQDFLPTDGIDLETAKLVFWMTLGYMQSKFQLLNGEL